MSIFIQNAFSSSRIGREAGNHKNNEHLGEDEEAFWSMKHRNRGQKEEQVTG